jgi:hypothetical protein
MSNYICWTKYGESGVMMEEDEEKQLDHNDIITEYGSFLNDTPLHKLEEEVVVEDELTDDIGDTICDAQRECESKKDKIKFEHMLEDHNKLLYPTTKEGQKKVRYNTGIAVMGGKEWCIRQGIWALTKDPKKMLPKPNELSTTMYGRYMHVLITASYIVARTTRI